MYCAPLTWQEQENLGYKAHLTALTEVLCFCVRPGCKLDRNYNLFAGPTSWCTGSQNYTTQRYVNPLSNSICRRKRNVLLLRNVAQQSPPFGSAQLS
jgi:hypothetical protein